MYKAKDLRDQSIEELEALHENLRKDLFAFINGHSQNAKAEQAHRIPQTRRDVARVLTVIKEKKSSRKAVATEVTL